MINTSDQYDSILEKCRDIFVKKMKDYGTSWRILRLGSITDQVFIKGNRVRTLQEKGISKVGEGIRPEFMAIVNYSIMAQIHSSCPSLSEAVKLMSSRSFSIIVCSRLAPIFSTVVLTFTVKSAKLSIAS